VLFENRKYQSLQWPMWMNSWQQNPISYKNKIFIKSELQWRFTCKGLKTLQQYDKAILDAPELSLTSGNHIARC